MRHKIIAHLGIAAILIFAAGCHLRNSEATAKMTETGPKGTHESDAQWYAMCKDQTPDGHQGTWKGPVRLNKEWAIRDAAAHEKQYPGHHATVEHTY